MVQNTGGVPALGEATLGEFKANLRGEVICPGDSGYETHRKVWNGMIDRRPALIVRCCGAADVATAVQFARSHGLLVAVRGGGHNVAGNAVCDGGIVIDLSLMKGVRVNLAARSVRAQAGVTWGELDHETQSFGLATTGGVVSTTGIGGLTLGGGIGWLMRKYGLTCDNLLSVDVVTADGRYIVASASEHPDLFWGVRGGGGNFGIVTSFKYRLHPVSTITGGMIIYSASQFQDTLRFYRDFCATAPDELTTLATFFTAPPEEFIPAPFHGTTLLGIYVCYCGTSEQAELVLRPLQAFGSPVANLLGTMPYSALQMMVDNSYPAGQHYYWKSDYITDLNNEVIEKILVYVSRKTSPLSAVNIHQLQGAIKRISADTTAFGHRDAPFLVNAAAGWSESDQAEQHIQWARDLSAEVVPYSKGSYVNFVTNEGEAGIRASYDPAAYKRLVALKHTYDPTNLFHLNQNIAPEM
jgi:FAD/FMN-containing dehydrogenase